MVTEVMYGGIEAGGTKFNCIIGRGPDQILAEATFPTTTPEATFGRVAEFFRPFSAANRLEAIGIGSFGPCDIHPGSPTYGHITSTPKPGWQNTDIAGNIRAALSVEVAFDTDVNAAALGEHTWGATTAADPSLYITVGTGIGGGLIVDGRPLHGLQHPEMGHIRVRHDQALDPFPGSCPFHGDCLEGLASGPALRARFGSPAESLPDDDPFWELECDYLAEAVCTYILVVSPMRIVMGGGIMQRTFLLPSIRQKVKRGLAGYVRHGAVADGIDAFIVTPQMGSRSGVLGALALAAILRSEDQH